jgi:hypothetical protein
MLALTVVGVLAACSSGSSGSSPDDEGSPSAAAETPADKDATAAAPSGDLEPGSSSLGYPETLGDTLLDAEAAAGLAWTTDPTLLYVITLGSSTCPVVAEPDATGDAAGVVVSFVPIPADTACTMDLVPTTTVVALPDGIGPDVDLTVDLDGIGSATLPAFEAVAGAPVLVPVTAG